MDKCMFGCPSDDLELPDHWEKNCAGNPESEFTKKQMGEQDG